MTETENLLDLLNRLDQQLEEENERRRGEGGFGFQKAKMKLVGQYGLLMHPDRLLDRLDLVSTADVDVLIEADHFVKKEFERLLTEVGLEYDTDSEKAWIPAGATFTTIFSSPRLVCEVLDPIFSLTSKAVKAKEKNRILVRKALKVFGAPLRKMIVKHGGDCDYFETEPRSKN